MRGRSGTRGTKLHMRLVRLSIRDKFLEIVNCEVLTCDQHNWDLSDEDDRCEIVHCVVERVLIQRLALRMRADGAEHELIAIRRGLGDTLRTGHPTGTADVLYDDLLTKHLTHMSRDDAAKHVCGASCGERNDHCHWPRRKVLCAC